MQNLKEVVSDGCVEGWSDLARESELPMIFLLALLAEGITLVAMGTWILIVG